MQSEIRRIPFSSDDVRSALPWQEACRCKTSSEQESVKKAFKSAIKDRKAMARSWRVLRESSFGEAPVHRRILWKIRSLFP